MRHSTLPALAPQPDTYTDLSKSWIGKQFEPNTVVSAWLPISVVDSLLCEDVADSTLPILMIQIADNLVKLSTDSPQLIDRYIPCHAFLERLDFH